MLGSISKLFMSLLGISAALSAAQVAGQIDLGVKGNSALVLVNTIAHVLVQSFKSAQEAPVK